MTTYIKALKVFTVLGIAIMSFHSCTSPKAYQKMYLNDAEMELSPRHSEKFESSFQTYREGASGANGGKTGGGCGCN